MILWSVIVRQPPYFWAAKYYRWVDGWMHQAWISTFHFFALSFEFECSITKKDNFIFAAPPPSSINFYQHPAHLLAYMLGGDISMWIYRLDPNISNCPFWWWLGSRNLENLGNLGTKPLILLMAVSERSIYPSYCRQKSTHSGRAQVPFGHHWRRKSGPELDNGRQDSPLN